MKVTPRFFVEEVKSMESDPKVPELTTSSFELPVSVPQFLDDLNANGKKTISREFFYRRLKDGSLPHLRLGKKIMVFPSQIFSAMQK